MTTNSTAHLTPLSVDTVALEADTIVVLEVRQGVGQYYRWKLTVAGNPSRIFRRDVGDYIVRPVQRQLLTLAGWTPMSPAEDYGVNEQLTVTGPIWLQHAAARRPQHCGTIVEIEVLE